MALVSPCEEAGKRSVRQQQVDHERVPPASERSVRQQQVDHERVPPARFVTHCACRSRSVPASTVMGSEVNLDVGRRVLSSGRAEPLAHTWR
jgi:hypothetical protein